MSEGDVRVNGKPALDATNGEASRPVVDWSWATYKGSVKGCQEIHEGFAVNPPEMQRLLEGLRPALPKEQGRYAIFGCYALNTYNVPRETHDIDIAIAARDYDAVVAAAAASVEPPTFLKRTSDWQTVVVHPIRRAEKLADLVLAEANPVLDAILRNPKATRWLHVPRFGEAWVLAPEAVIATKYYSANDPARGTPRRVRDLSDVLETLQQPELDPPLDRALVRELVAAIPIPRASELFDRMISRIDAGKLPEFPWSALDE
jgi:hypothetical protein